MKKENFECPECEMNWKWFYYTDDKTEIKEALQNEINSALKLCWNVAVKIAKKEKPKEVVDYLLRVNPFDTSLSELQEGFIREPKTEKEWKEATLHESDDGFEWSDTDIHEADTGDCKSCEKYIKRNAV